LKKKIKRVFRKGKQTQTPNIITKPITAEEVNGG